MRLFLCLSQRKHRGCLGRPRQLLPRTRARPAPRHPACLLAGAVAPGPPYLRTKQLWEVGKGRLDVAIRQMVTLLV